MDEKKPLLESYRRIQNAPFKETYKRQHSYKAFKKAIPEAKGYQVYGEELEGAPPRDEQKGSPRTDLDPRSPRWK